MCEDTPWPPDEDDMSKVECDQRCGALVDPKSFEEIRLALEHVREHTVDGVRVRAQHFQ